MDFTEIPMEIVTLVHQPAKHATRYHHAQVVLISMLLEVKYVYIAMILMAIRLSMENARNYVEIANELARKNVTMEIL